MLESAERELTRFEIDRRVMRLDDMLDDEIEDMLSSGIPHEHRYGLKDVPN
ncbi:MAG TPA: hypothetical protein VGM07_18590 [Stellaceae bacterium]|jgi:hypothetical protein